jgi:hypothetical protein
MEMVLSAGGYSRTATRNGFVRTIGIEPFCTNRLLKFVCTTNIELFVLVQGPGSWSGNSMDSHKPYQCASDVIVVASPRCFDPCHLLY